MTQIHPEVAKLLMRIEQTRAVGRFLRKLPGRKTPDAVLDEMDAELDRVEADVRSETPRLEDTLGGWTLDGERI